MVSGSLKLQKPPQKPLRTSRFCLTWTVRSGFARWY